MITNYSFMQKLAELMYKEIVKTIIKHNGTIILLLGGAFSVVIKQTNALLNK